MKPLQIPRGFKVFLPREARQFEFMADVLLRIVRMWGYQPIIPPTIEYLDTFKLVDSELERLSFKLVDRFTGKLLAVRPDFTPQIARIIATSFKDEKPPFRFYYIGSAYRDVGTNRQVNQLGWELLGVRDVEADAEIVSIVANIMKELGLSSFQIDIGHVGFLNGVVSELGINGDLRSIFFNLLHHKDISGLSVFLRENNFDDVVAGKVSKLLNLYGKQDVLERAYSIFKNEESISAIESLESMFEILKSYGFERNIIFDLTERRGMDYHTGITFDVFHPILGYSIASGGRYDKLIGRFGRDLPATGIAVNLDRLQILLDKKNLFRKSFSGDYYIVDVKKELKKAYELAKLLREKGYRVARDIVKRDIDESVSVALSKGFKYILVLNAKDLPSNYLYVYSKSGRKKQSLDQFLEEV